MDKRSELWPKFQKRFWGQSSLLQVGFKLTFNILKKFLVRTHGYEWVDHYQSVDPSLVRCSPHILRTIHCVLNQIRKKILDNLTSSIQFTWLVRYADSWLKNRNFVLDFKARDVTLCSSLSYFLKISLAYANANFKVASCNDDSAVSMNIPKGQKESKNLL